MFNKEINVFYILTFLDLFYRRQSSRNSDPNNLTCHILSNLWEIHSAIPEKIKAETENALPIKNIYNK